MSHYRGYRQRTRIVARPSLTLSAAAFALVVGALALDWSPAAGVVTAWYVVLAGRAGGRAPTWHVFMFANVLLLLCLWASMYRHHTAGVLLFGGLALIASVTTMAVSRLATRPGDR